MTKMIKGSILRELFNSIGKNSAFNVTHYNPNLYLDN
jgi:hypothetical protein